MRPNRRCAPFAALLLPLLIACDPEVKVERAEGIAVFEELSGDGTAKLVDATTLDFGPVLIGSRAERKVILRNDGRGSFRVDAVVESEDFDPSFRYQFEPMTLEVGDRVELVFYFEPSGAPGDRASTLTLRILDANIEQPVINLKGRAVNGGCVIEPQEVLDFGNVALGTTFTRQVRITNSSDLPWTVTIAGITSELDPESFVFAGFEAGEITVPEHGEITVPIEFRPAHLGEHSAFLHIPAPAMCKPNILTLSGRGVDSVLECEPKVLATDPSSGTERWVWRLDFGFVNPGSKSVLPVVCTNLGNTDITLTGFELQQPPGKGEPFALETQETSLVAAAGGGIVEIPLSFEPRLLGLQVGALHLLTDDAKTPEAKVELVGTGGGPDIEVLPTRLDLGRVAVDTTKSRAITIANVGTDISGTTEDNLRLVVKQDGEWVEKRAELITDWADEFSLGDSFIGYLPPGIAAGTNVTLKIFFSPTSPGRKSAVVRIYSNDPDEPVVEVEVVASAEVLPPCDYEVVPSQIHFGVVEQGQYSTIPFFVRNKAADPLDVCIVATLGFTRGTPDAFSLPEGEITEAVIQGGEVLEVPVRFSTRAEGQYTGGIEFYVSSPAAPMGHVALSGTSQKGCLLIAPKDLDFGPVEVECSARERVFTIYNVCPSNITLTSIETQQSLSTEFRLTQRPALPATLAPSEEAEFRMTYRPVDVGEDFATVAIQTSQIPAPFVVTLTGRGETVAIQTDVFAQDAQPKADVLFVIDDSCSMDNEQADLGRNFAAFIRFAVSQQVDYHIAVTTTSVSSSASDENGRFVPLAGGNPRVITPTTPNKELVFQQNVNVGTSGDAYEKLIRPAYLGLSSPLIDTHNAGFLREEANLAVIVVSDAADQDTTPLAFYENFFLNIKGHTRRNMFTFNGIIPTFPQETGSCSYDESTAGQSTRVKSLVTRTAGVYDDICTPDWSLTLEKVGKGTFGFRTRFFLSSTPDTSQPIVVELDGQPYDATGPYGDQRWSYDSNANAIDFVPLAAPEPGSTLTITYHVACM